MAKKFGGDVWRAADKIKGPDPKRPKNKHKRRNYKKYRGQGR